MIKKMFAGVVIFFVLGMITSVVIRNLNTNAVTKDEVLTSGSDDLFGSALEEAELGQADAQFSLATMFLLGDGVQQDYPKAAEWYTRAAEQGHSASQHNLGLMYANGQGVQQNYAGAAKWLTIQGQAGYHSVCDANGDGRIDMGDFEVLAEGWMGN